VTTSGTTGGGAGVRLERADPFVGGGAAKPVGLGALHDELERAMEQLVKAKKAEPPPYFIAYEAFDRDETVVSASYGALVQSSSRRTHLLDADVRVGSYQLDSTHPLRSDALDFGADTDSGHAVWLPLAADAGVTRAVAWLDTDRTYKNAAEQFVKIRTQQTLKAAEEDTSDDFSHEKPVTRVGTPVHLGLSGLDRERWEERVRALSRRFKGHANVYDSQVTLQVSSVDRWIVNSEGTLVEDAENYVRVYLQAETRADDGMELDRFESFDATSFDTLAGDPEILRAADAMIADLEALRRAPLADPYIGPAILEGKAAGVFFHEIFGHRVEATGRRTKKKARRSPARWANPSCPPSSASTTTRR